MAQFILDTSGAVPGNGANPITAWDNLDEFTQGYITALFFTETESGTDRSNFDPSEGSALPGDAAFDDLDPDTLGGIVDDCAAFQAANAEIFEELDVFADGGWDMSKLGHDYWLTRNGHGAGYWDREELDVELSGGNAREMLTTAARNRGDVDAYWSDDGRVVLS